MACNSPTVFGDVLDLSDWLYLTYKRSNNQINIRKIQMQVRTNFQSRDIIILMILIIIIITVIIILLILQIFSHALLLGSWKVSLSSNFTGLKNLSSHMTDVLNPPTNVSSVIEQ